MQRPTIPTKLPKFSAFNRLSRKHRITVAGSAAAAALVLSVTGLEATAGAGSATAAGTPAASTAPVAAIGSTPFTGTTGTTGTTAAVGSTGFAVVDGGHVEPIAAKAGMASQLAIHDAAQQKKDAADAAKKKAAEAAASKKAAVKKAADKQAAAKKAAEKKKAEAAAAHRAKAKQAAKRSAKRAPVYANNLDGWIRQSLAIMHTKGIPGSYSGIHRNIIRESSGNPKAINLWDINAQNGIPSKGLLQVIKPTFDRYHVAGTSWNVYNPVANITAACNYAAARYGSMDNVNSAY